MKLASLLLLLPLACSSAPTRPVLDRLHSGRLTYQALSEDGHVLVTGEMNITVVDSVVTGTWQLHWAPGADTTTHVGPQIGEGTLAGRQVGDSYAIDLNPGWADNNVFLSAELTASGWSGTWSWSTIAGVAASGPFGTTQTQ